MKVFHRDLSHGLVKLRPESVDDLWYLGQIICRGDRVSALTSRRIKDKDDSLRSSGGERRTVRLTVAAEKADFSAGEGALRVTGVVVEGPEDVITLGSHHTLGLELGEVVSITKDRWLSSELARLKDAVESTARSKFIVVAVEDGEATVGVVRESGVEFVEVSHPVGGKYDTKGRGERLTAFHTQLAKVLEQADAAENASRVILCGPGFFKNGFVEYLKSGGASALSAKILVENTGASGRNAVKEVLNRPIIQKLTEDAAVGRDMQLMQKLLAEVGKDGGLSSYGLSDVKNAVEAGAVDTLLVSTKFFVEKRLDVDRLLRDLKASSGVFRIVNSGEEPGRGLDALGGVAALLRYRIQ